MNPQLDIGETLILEGKWEEAEKHFNIMNDEFPDQPDILNNLGVIANSTGRLRDAENCFLNAVKCNSRHANALMNLAHLYSKTARWRLSTKCLEQVIAIGEATVDCYNQLAVNCLNIADIEKARHAFEASLDINAEQPIIKDMLQEVKKINPSLNQNGAPDYRTAFCEINITPPISEAQPIFLQGMAGNPRQADSVASPLKMQMMLLEDRNDTRLLFVTADLLGFDDRMVDDIRKAAGQWGIAPEGIILNASHTHYAPGTMAKMLPAMGHYYEDYADQIKALIIKCLTKLYHSLEPSRIYLSATESQIGVNRRLEKDGHITFGPNSEGPYDSLTPFLVVDMCESDQVIILVNHGCHPTGLGQMAEISADFPGYLRDALISGGFAHRVMFFQGAAGDIKEATQNEKITTFASSHQDIQQNGERLAVAIVNALQNPVQPITGNFFCLKELVRLPLKTPISTEHIQMLANDETSMPLIREWAKLFLAPIRDQTFERDIPIEVQWVSIGEQLRFVTMQGEPVASFAEKIRSLVGIPESTFILGYTNGLRAYLPTDNMIDQGGYEVDFSHLVYPQPSGLARGMESQITEAISRLKQNNKEVGEANGYGRYHLTTKPKRAFFVLSSGRCGTMTLAHVLNTAENARVWHHPQPDPILESLQAYRGEIDKQRVFWRSRRSLINESWANGLIHGETDLLMTPFCDVIAEEIPEAKFILLVRDPRNFVRSGMRRNYYEGHAWDFGRLRPKECDPEYREWNNFSQFEKICWLWNKTYEEVKEKIKKIGADRIITIRFEELVNNTSVLKSLFNFLELEGFDSVSVNTLLSKKFNKQVSGTFGKPTEWPENYHRTLWKHCGKTAETFGYEYHKKKSVPDEKIKTTIWDFKKFDHQPYPDKLTPEIVSNRRKSGIIIDSKTKIASMGSCFARNIAIELMQRNYNYIVTEQPFDEFSAHWGQLFNTACIRQVFEYTFEEGWLPLTRWWDKGATVQDPFRRNIIYDGKHCDENFKRHQHASKLALVNADVVIITLGLIETWRDMRDRMTFYRVPSPTVYDPTIHEFHIQSVDECINDLKTIHRLMQKYNPPASLIVSVSPVPLFATFRKDTDVVSANTFSKSTLRVAAEYFCSQYENVSYFPSFEIATQLIQDPYESDHRHVTRSTISKIMDTFLTYYS